MATVSVKRSSSKWICGCEKYDGNMSLQLTQDNTIAISVYEDCEFFCISKLISNKNK